MGAVNRPNPRAACAAIRSENCSLRARRKRASGGSSCIHDPLLNQRTADPLRN
jgi:hypothetical protein